MTTLDFEIPCFINIFLHFLSYLGVDFSQKNCHFSLTAAGYLHQFQISDRQNNAETNEYVLRA